MHKKFMIQSSSLLRQAEEWVDLEWDKNLPLSEDFILSSCLCRLKSLHKTLVALHQWIEDNTNSGDLSRVIYLVGGIKKLTNSWASQNISK